MCVVTTGRLRPTHLDSPVGLIGPMHKRNFTLQGGQCLNDEAYSILTFDVRVEDSNISLLLPDTDVLDDMIGTRKWMVKQHTAEIIDRGLGDGIEVVGSLGCSTQSGVCSSDPRLDW